jgi:hypothetical protein
MASDAEDFLPLFFIDLTSLRNYVV